MFENKRNKDSSFSTQPSFCRFKNIFRIFLNFTLFLTRQHLVKGFYGPKYKDRKIYMYKISPFLEWRGESRQLPKFHVYISTEKSWFNYEYSWIFQVILVWIVKNTIKTKVLSWKLPLWTTIQMTRNSDTFPGIAT